MQVSDVKKALIEQRKINLKGNLYHKTQIDFAYNTNHIEGSTITPDETASIFESGTILANNDKVIVLKDATETKNHFTLFKYMLDTLDNPLDEDMIKKYHFILKDGTLTDSEKEWFNVGEYKKLANEAGNMQTSLPKNVVKDMAKLMEWYNSLEKITIKEIIEFHYRFERIHPFQDGNGRVGRIIAFKECLKNNIIPFIILDKEKLFYYRGLKEYKNEKGFLVDTCLNAQDQYIKMIKFYIGNKM